jgi:hypothetical protein
MNLMLFGHGLIYFNIKNTTTRFEKINNSKTKMTNTCKQKYNKI